MPQAEFASAEELKSVLGVQKASWDETVDYASQIGVCRTFVFFHEIEFLFNNNLVKGGDVDNAIVIVEHPVSQEQLDRMAHLFNIDSVTVNSDGYLSNLTLHFPNEYGQTLDRCPRMDER